MALQRVSHWEAVLSLFFTNRRTMPYAWGSNDCCTFAADAILAITGTDLAEEFRGYTDQAGAYTAIKRVCNGSSASDAVVYAVKKHGIPERKSSLFAQRGDLLLVKDAGGQIIVGICDMHGNASCVTDSGLHQFPLSSVITAYQI